VQVFFVGKIKIAKRVEFSAKSSAVIAFTLRAC